jgi:cob(I)alamin adenosyltransferase
MKTLREEKLEKKLQKVQNDLVVTRKELHTSKQKIRDITKSREGYKEKVKHLQDELKKKL